MLDIGLERRLNRGPGTSATNFSSMTPDVLPVASRWANSSKAIDTATHRRSPILGKQPSSFSASPARNNVASGSSNLTTPPPRPSSGSVLKRLDDDGHDGDTSQHAIPNGTNSNNSPAHKRHVALHPLDEVSLAAAAALHPPSPSPVPASTESHHHHHHHHHQHHAAHGESVTPVGGMSLSKQRKVTASQPQNRRLALAAGVFASPVKLGSRGRHENVDFNFVAKLRDPIKEQFRRAEAVISAIPSRNSAALPSVVDNGNPMSSAAVLDGLTRRVALLQHDKSAQSTERTASAVMGTHIAALLDLSRSLAITDPNAAEVAKRVHEVITSHVIKSVSEPLERVSTLCDAARRDAERAQDECSSLRAQVLDLQVQVNALRRQVRRRNDLVAYLTSAYNLPNSYVNSVLDDPEQQAAAMAIEASPTSMIKDHKRAAERALNDSHHSRSSLRHRGVPPLMSGAESASSSVSARSAKDENSGDESGAFDPRTFAVRIPSAEEKLAFMSLHNKSPKR